MKIEGYGYEWDAKLNGGPADGCLDRVIQINGSSPPKEIIRIVDGEEMERESLGEKLIEHLTRNNLDENQMVAVYKLTTNLDNEEEIKEYHYEYIETIKFGKFKTEYS